MKDTFEPKLLHRKRINETLEELVDHPLTLLISSIGYGKTTAVRSYLQSRKDVKQVWFNFSPNETDNQWMWSKFCSSLSHTFPDLYPQLEEIGLPRSTMEQERFIMAIEDVVQEPLVIVIDDYHENKSREMDQLITAFARSATPNVHILLISRSFPDIPVIDLMIKGLCKEISQDWFEFSKEETIELFKLNGFTLTQEEEDTLLRITDGWVSAIYLSLLKYAVDGHFEDTKSITRLIKTSVYDNFHEEIQETLLKLSLLEEFSIEGAIYVTGNKKAGQQIYKIAQNNCFIRYNHKERSYTMHNLLQQMLKEYFTLSEMDKKSLFSRCGDWCAKCGEKISAISFYYKAEAYEKILDLFEQPGSSELLDKAPNLINKAFRAMDKRLKLSRPIAYITYIYSYLISVDLTVGQEMLEETKKYYEAQDTLHNKERILGEIALAESFLCFNQVSLMNLTVKSFSSQEKQIHPT